MLLQSLCWCVNVCGVYSPSIFYIIFNKIKTQIFFPSYLCCSQKICCKNKCRKVSFSFKTKKTQQNVKKIKMKYFFYIFNGVIPSPVAPVEYLCVLMCVTLNQKVFLFTFFVFRDLLRIRWHADLFTKNQIEGNRLFNIGLSLLL